jgi:cytochrome c-type biogenesis protein CcmF
VPIAIVLMLMNGLSLALKWRQSSKKEMIRKSVGSLVLAVALGIALYFAGIRDLAYSAIIVASLFALFINLEVAYRLTKGRIGFFLDKHAAFRSRMFGALKWSIGLGVLAVIFLTNGDYYRFGYTILDGGLYWLGFTVLLIVCAVLIGRFGIKLDKRFIGPYVAHAGLALFILGVVASSHYEDKRDFELIEGESTTVFDGAYTLMYGGYEFTHPQNYHFNINVTDEDGDVATARPVLFASAFDNYKNYNPNPGILKFTARDLYFTVKGVERSGGPPTDSLLKGATIPVFGGKVDLTFHEFDFSQEERAKMLEQKPFRVKAVLIATERATGKVDTLVTSVTRDLQKNNVKKEDVIIGTSSYHVQLSELRPNLEDRSKSQIFIETFDEADPPPPMKDKIFVEAYIKPYINLVWLGVLVLTVGFALATIRRRREAIASIEKAERAFDRFKAAQAEGHAPVHGAHTAHRHPAKKSA